MVSAQPAANGHVAIVDDEVGLRETVSFALKRDGYQVAAYPDGSEAWAAFQRELPDVVVLDIVMPGLDGLELCRRLRGLSDRLPILFLSSRDEEVDRVLGLELGADDYLCKPFSVRELRARVKVMFRRLALDATVTEEQLLESGDLVLDLNRYEVRWRDELVTLTITEFLLLLALVRRPGYVKTRRQLMEEAYPDDAFVSERTIDSHVKRMRRKFAQVDPEFDRVETIYGLGYRFR